MEIINLVVMNKWVGRLYVYFFKKVSGKKGKNYEFNVFRYKE